MKTIISEISDSPDRPVITVDWRDWRSPLRYPGGKQKDLPIFTPYFRSAKEYREPFLGGGSVLLHAIGSQVAQEFWANDANPLLMDFWRQVQTDAIALARLVRSLRDDYDGEQHKCDQWVAFRDRYQQKLADLPGDRLHNAARFFILNRSTASGLTESGGMTAAAYCGRFTESSIQRLENLQDRLAGVRLTLGDYRELIHAPGEDVFIFLDPPYFSAEQSRLYGRSGDLHKGFNHQQLADELRDCPHDWLMTIDDCDAIQDLYSNQWADLRPWTKPYSMTNTQGRRSKAGRELLIAKRGLLANA
ncbi:MAG: DNA adenine methylase [Oscillatoriales cyanobacterium]|nr:MAG: DNA adenine methylase [Oscillatoriales cyanobacterium]